MGDAGRIGWKRAAGGLALGHLAAAASFSAVALIVASILDPAAALPRTAAEVWAVLKALALAPFMVAMLGALTSIAMLPASLLTAPFAWFAARRLHGEASTALAVGAAVGAAETAAFVTLSGGFRGPWSRTGLPGDPRSDLLIVACGAVAGVAYAGVVWWLCVRPRMGSAPVRAA